MASCTAAKKRASRHKAANNVVQTAPICKLPTNIVLQVFNYLNVKTLCALSTVCRRWYHLVCDRSLWKYVDPRLWPLSLRTLKKIVRNRLSDSVLELLIKGFIGTTKKGENISPSLLEEIKTKCPSLETLGLSYCDMRNIPPQCLPRNLKSLLLDHSIVPLGWFEGLQCETFFPSLLQLNLTYCTRVENSDLRSITKLTRLENLNFSYCYRVGDEGIEHIARNLSNLKVLDLSNCPKITDLGLHHIGRHLIGLKRLNLLSSWRITDAGILSLVHSLTELEYLNLSSCKEVTNSGLTEITDKCKKLKLLDVRGCTAITERNETQKCPRIVFVFGPIWRNEAALFVRELLGSTFHIYGNLIYTTESTCFGTKMAAYFNDLKDKEGFVLCKTNRKTFHAISCQFGQQPE